MSGPAVARHPLQDHAARARALRTGELPHDLAVFAGLLRDIGAGVSPASSLLALRALTVIRLDRKADVRAALGCCLVSDPRERALFDGVFETFWGAEPEVLVAPDEHEDPSGEGDDAPGGGDSSPLLEAGDGSERLERQRASRRATYSRAAGRPGPVGARRRREVEELAQRLASGLGTVEGRRSYAARRGAAVDLRTSLRHNLGNGGELLDLRYRRRRRDRPRLAVFCDVSSSMRPSTPLFLAFVHALTRRARRVETAVFNVDTAVVTEVFRRMELSDALRWLAHQQVALSGGTRIGHCLHAFLDDLEARRVLRPDTVVLVLSDGWDVGEPELLAAGMRRLRNQVGRLVWCDPHAAAAGFRPAVQGLQVALPFVDDYLDFSSVDSLAHLVDHLASSAPSFRQPVERISHAR